MHFLQKLSSYLFKYRGHLFKAERPITLKCQNKWCSSLCYFKPVIKHGRAQFLSGFHSSVRSDDIFLPARIELNDNHLTVHFLHTSSTHVTQYRAGKHTEKEADNHSRLSTMFKYTLEELPEVIKKYTFLSHMSLSLIELKIKIMEAYNLPMSFMKENMRIFYHVSTSELIKRLNLLKNNGFLDENPVLSKDKLGHYLECSNEVFHLGLQKLCSEMQSLEGCSSQVEYIQKRLQCSKERAVIITSSYPLNRNVSNAKLKEFFDFVLIEANLSPSIVALNMRLCSFSITRLRERMKVMQVAMITQDKWPAIWNWTESKFITEFRQFI